MPVVRETFRGFGRLYVAGSEVAASDRAVKAAPHLFVFDVEQATAGPGERRNVIIPDPTCAGTTAAGNPCSNPAGDGGFCRHHGDG